MLEHHTLPGYKSRVVVDSSVVSFDLDLVWGQNTFDGPHQLWRASSDYSLKVTIIFLTYDTEFYFEWSWKILSCLWAETAHK